MKKRPLCLNIFFVVFFISVLLFFSISSLKNKSITLDEEKYIHVGQYVIKNLFDWQAGNMFQNNLSGWLALHPPLTYYFHGLSFFIFPFQEAQKELFYARLIMQAILILFALSVFLTARRIYKLNSGLFALLLFIFNTEILAHGRLIGPDLSLAFFIFLTLISFYFFLKKEKFIDLFKTGVFLGLSLLAKYNALLLIPLFLIVLIYYLLFIKRKLDLKLILKFAFILFLAIVIVNIGYVFNGSFKLPEKFISPNFNIIAQSRLGRVLLSVFPKNYLIGADYQYYISKTGWIGFLMGETKWGGWWYFYIAAFLIKTQIPLLILILLFLFLGKKKFFEKYILFSIFFFFFYHSFFNIINNGFRYLLMTFPLLILLVSNLINYKPKKLKRFYKIALLGLGCWYIIELILIYPHYLAYFNQFIGGPKNGYKYMADSNLDFGQDRELAQKYFNQHPEIIVNPEEPVLGKVATSVNFLNLAHDKNFWLRKIEKTPVDYINYSWLIFDISKKDLEKLKNAN